MLGEEGCSGGLFWDGLFWEVVWEEGQRRPTNELITYELHPRRLENNPSMDTLILHYSCNVLRSRHMEREREGEGEGEGEGEREGEGEGEREGEECTSVTFGFCHNMWPGRPLGECKGRVRIYSRYTQT